MNEAMGMYPIEMVVEWGILKIIEDLFSTNGAIMGIYMDSYRFWMTS